jgi:hypothetical protein
MFIIWHQNTLSLPVLYSVDLSVRFLVHPRNLYHVARLGILFKHKQLLRIENGNKVD